MGIWFFVDLCAFIVFPFMWLAVYGDRQEISGFTRADIVTYYVLVGLVNSLAVSHFARHVRNDVIRGELSSILTKPMHYLFYRSLQDFAYHIISFFFFGAIFVTLLVFRVDYISLPASITNTMLFFIAVLLSYLISCMLEFIVSLSAFWLGESGALAQMRTMVEAVFSGHLAPLIFFPLFLQKIGEFLPFRFQIYFPIQVYLGKLSPLELVYGFAGALAWIGVLTCFVLLIWRQGLRRYEGAGI